RPTVRTAELQPLRNRTACPLRSSGRSPSGAWSTWPLHTLHVQAHAASRTCDGPYGSFQFGSGQISLLGLGDLFQLGTGNGADLLGIGTSGTAGNASSFLQQHGCRGALGFKSEAAVTVDSDDHRSRQTRLLALSAGVERLAELHDVHAMLTQCRADRRRRVGLTGLYLKLDISLNLLSHSYSVTGSNAFRLPLLLVYPSDDKTPQPLAAG